MSDYDEIKKRIKHEIQDCHILKEAQVPDSAHALRYQSRITALTDMLHKFEGGLPRLRDLDQKIRVAQFDLEDAYRSVQAGAAPWPKAAAWTGGLGAFGLFGSLGFGLPWPVTVASVVLVGLGGLCVVLAVRRKRVDHDDLHHARLWLSDLFDERDGLMPSDLDAAIENAGKERVAVPVRVLDDRPVNDDAKAESRPVEQTDGASTG